MARKRQTTHNQSRTLLYKTWQNMRRRCLNPRHPLFKWYGGRGITICDRWGNFEAFRADMGEKPGPEYSLDRIDVNGNYEPSNCRWATYRQQANNTTINRHLEFGDRRLTVTEWSREVGISAAAIRGRLKHGWPIDKALTIPASRSNAHLHALNFSRSTP